ncbi:Sodium-coupled monocarboxylate transporter 1 [Chamberlinius hualienensis]
MDYRFQTLDYIVVFVLMFSSAGYGLYASNVKHKQTTLIEYFLAGKNISVWLVILSYFSSFCAGGVTGQTIEVYLCGSQILIFMITVPIMVLIVNYLVIPVFYPLQNMSMLQRFKKRFGNEVAIVAMIASITIMVLTGSVNIFISAIVINQGLLIILEDVLIRCHEVLILNKYISVSALSFWVAATATTGLCILYSTLGGMRGIVIADAIQAILMIISIILLLIIGVVKAGGLTAVWNINSQYDRLQLFNFNLDPSERYTFWSACFGFGFVMINYNAMSQPLLQRCIMAPNLKSAQNVAITGIVIGLTYVFLHQVLGLVTFAYYAGCDIQATGKIKSINQAGVTFLSIICGPTFAIYCIGILCPKSQSKYVAVSYGMGFLFGCYILVGSVLGNLTVLSKSFSNCSFNVTDNATALSTIGSNKTIDFVVQNNLDIYFPFNKVSYTYITLEVFLVTVISFILLSLVSVKLKRTRESNLAQFDLNLIPPCVQKCHLRLSKNCRKWLLCDVYDNNVTRMPLATEQQPIMSHAAEDNRQLSSRLH